MRDVRALGTTPNMHSVHPTLETSSLLASTPVSLATAADATLASLPLPVSVAAAVHPPIAPLPAVDAGLPPVLVADDDPDDTFFIQRLIKKTGVKNPVKAFDDGTELVNYLGARQAAGCLRRGAPHLLFLDLRMAGLGGFGFLEWARQQKNLMPLTIVVLSASSSPEDVARALELGAHRYLIKYPSLQTINTIVRSVYPQTVF